MADDRGEFGFPAVGSIFPIDTQATFGWHWEPQPRFQGWMRRSCCKAPDIMSHHYADCEHFDPSEVRKRPIRDEWESKSAPDAEVDHIFLPVFPKTKLAKRIVQLHAPMVFAHFMRRNAEYGDDNDFDLGSRGQYVDISRKVQKLKRRMWEGRPERDGEESTRTIVTELIGHLFMTLDYLSNEEQQGEQGEGREV